MAHELEPRVQGLPGLLDSARVHALETAAELTGGDAGRALLTRALEQAERSGLPEAKAWLTQALNATR